MPNPTYYSAVTNLITYISSASTSHKLVESFGQGESDDHAITGSDLYPRVFLEYPFVSNYTERGITWKLVIILTDIELKERTDEVDKLSLTYDILNDILEKFRQEQESYILVDTSINCVSLTEYSDDNCAGWRCEFDINQAIPMNRCDISDQFILPEHGIYSVNGLSYLPVNKGGTVYYIKSKQFTIDSNGNLITPEGYYLMKDNSTILTFTTPPFVNSGITISNTGILSLNGEDYQLLVADFLFPLLLNNTGNEYYVQTTQSGAPVLSYPSNIGVTISISS